MLFWKYFLDNAVQIVPTNTILSACSMVLEQKNIIGCITSSIASATLWTCFLCWAWQPIMNAPGASTKSSKALKRKKQENSQNIKQYFSRKPTSSILQVFVNHLFYHLHNISYIRKYLSSNTTEILVYAFVFSKLDHYNSLIYGLLDYQIKKLQHVHNTAARLITLSRKHEHITPILLNLPWLPINYRIKQV